jgi:monoamine oxidase
MIFSENRFPLFGIMRCSAPRVAVRFNENSLQFGSLAARAGNGILAMKFAAPRGFGQSGPAHVNHSDTMPRLSRRSFLAGSTALLAAPALRASAEDADVDVVIVGAGAAGIAAARRVHAGKARFALFEAGQRIGGRCVTDTALFGVPFDLGAHWMHNPGGNPLAALAPETGLEVYPAPRGQTVRVGPRNARDAELENFLTALVRSHRAIDEAGRGKTDMTAARALPADLGNWQQTIEFVLGPYTCGKPLTRVSAADLAHAGARDIAAFCRQGYGALLAKLAAGLPARLSNPVTKLDWDRRGIDVYTSKGRLRARTAIVTASTNVLAANKLEFKPELSRRVLDAAANLALGSYDHIGLLMPGNPLDLQRDDLVFEQASGPRTAALLARVSGTDLHLVGVAGDFGRELSAQGEPAMLDFARDWLAALFGPGVRNAIKRGHATRWNQEPWVLGAMSAATPGNADARKVLMEPLGGRVWFAGEAVHETKWGTVAGAWESGERAAVAALAQMGMLKKPEAERPARREREPRRRRQGSRDQ